MAAVRFRPNEGSTRVAAITNHALIQCAATACCCLGFYAIFHNKARPWVGDHGAGSSPVPCMPTAVCLLACPCCRTHASAL